MIITRKKEREALLAMLRGVRRAALVGCASCAAACQTGGEKELEETKAFLEDHGIQVLAAVLPEECCHKMLVKRDLKALRGLELDAVVCLACGDGVQTVADNVALPVYPANDTLFLGQVERVGIFHEYCRMCGDCVLGATGGICPVTRCAKGLVNGPCGGQKDGKCEVNPENDCAWILIYRRLERLGKLDSLLIPAGQRHEHAHPAHLNLREGAK